MWICQDVRRNFGWKLGHFPLFFPYSSVKETKKRNKKTLQVQRESTQIIQKSNHSRNIFNHTVASCWQYQLPSLVDFHRLTSTNLVWFLLVGCVHPWVPFFWRTKRSMSFLPRHSTCSSTVARLGVYGGLDTRLRQQDSGFEGFQAWGKLAVTKSLKEMVGA